MKLNVKKELEQIIEDQEISEALALPQLCRKGHGFDYILDQVTYCSQRQYDCVYKDDNNRCMNIYKMYKPN